MNQAALWKSYKRQIERQMVFFCCQIHFNTAYSMIFLALKDIDNYHTIILAKLSNISLKKEKIK